MKMLRSDPLRVETGATLADFTRVGLIAPILGEQETVGVIKELSQLLQKDGSVPDMLQFYNAALNREYLVNTAIEQGMAFPHARLATLPKLVFAIGRSKAPMIWGPRGTLPVRLVFLLAVPATSAAQYILLIASLAKLGREPERLERLLSAPDATAIYNILKEVPVQSGRPLEV